jgi:hypothetical protein
MVSAETGIAASRNPEPRPGDDWKLIVRGLESCVLRVESVTASGRLVRFASGAVVRLDVMVTRPDLWRLCRSRRRA